MTDTETDYNLALDYLYSFVDYSLKHASELAKADFNLDRMFALMDILGNPQNKYPIIHVAGTKGKGSVSALAASALQAAGYKTGLYTSPHLQDYVERIQVDKQPISHQELSDLVEEIKPAVAKVPYLTTFEITTALGFLYFARQNCDAAVIEVGLGGRLDATNIVMPLVSVITSLSLDHVLVLGDTLDKIAGEKAGIIKPGVPAVSAPQEAEALKVLVGIAEERGCEFILVGRDVEFKALSHSMEGQILQVSLSGGLSRSAHFADRIARPGHRKSAYVFNHGRAGETRSRSADVNNSAPSPYEEDVTIGSLLSQEKTSEANTSPSTTPRVSGSPSLGKDSLRGFAQGQLNLRIPLLGEHQVENAAVAYAALKASGLNVPDEAVQQGFATIQWPSRFEVIRRDPPVVIDVAHNRESALRLRQTLDTYYPAIPVVLLFCTLEDKDISGMMVELSPRVERVVATRADHPRAPSAEWIAEQVRKAGLPVEAVTPVAAALERALELAGDNKLLLTAGSVAFAGEVSGAWQLRKGSS